MINGKRLGHEIKVEHFCAKRKICILLFIFCVFILGACDEIDETESERISDVENDMQLDLNEDIVEEKQSEWEWQEDIDYLEKDHPRYFQDITEINESWKEAQDYGIYVNNYNWNQHSTAKIIIESDGGRFSTAEVNYINHIQIWLEHFSLEEEQYTVDSALNWIRGYVDMSIIDSQYAFKEAYHLKNDGWDSEYYGMRYLANNDDTAEKYGRLFCAEITTDHNGHVKSICLEHSTLNDTFRAKESGSYYGWEGTL